MNIHVNRAELNERVKQFVENAQVFDFHTHLYPIEFGKLNHWEKDDLFTLGLITRQLAAALYWINE